jgi:hypothetical protein
VPVPYISFDAVVGRNSQFKDLTSEQLEELGGVEYRGLKVLTWVVPLVSLSFPLPFTVPPSQTVLLTWLCPRSCSTSSVSSFAASSFSGRTSEPRVDMPTSSIASLVSSPSDGQPQSSASYLVPAFRCPI